MKKVFFSLAVLCSVALVSCGGNDKKECEDTTPMVEETAIVEEVATDSTDTAAAAAAAAEVAPVEAAADSAK